MFAVDSNDFKSISFLYDLSSMKQKIHLKNLGLLIVFFPPAISEFVLARAGSLLRSFPKMMKV
jgi:hypothetical protein